MKVDEDNVGSLNSGADNPNGTPVGMYLAACTHVATKSIASQAARTMSRSPTAPTLRCITCGQQVPRTATAVGLLERLAALAGYQAQDSG
jgi:hypothetical protein